MIPNPNEPPESGSLPDSNTSEAILYGPAYSWIKSALWAWDEMEDYLMRKADSLESQIMDRKWASDVLRTNRYLIFSRSPPVNELSKLQDLVTLRELCKTVAGIRKVNEYRKHNIAWARMKGIQQYVGSMKDRGITEAEWKAATASYNMEPINYDYVHGIVPSMLPGEYIDWNDAMRDLMGGEEYDELVKRIFGIDVSDVPVGEPETPKEENVEDDLTPFLKEFFSDPVQDVLSILEKDFDDLSQIRSYLIQSDIDDIQCTEQLIQFAEAIS